MNRILTKTQLTENIIRLELEAPEIAKMRKPGQFVILQIEEEYEDRIPLAIVDASPEQGRIAVVFVVFNAPTRQLARLEPGDVIRHIMGPLGTPTPIEDFGLVVCVAGGIGAAPIFPIARALKEAGNDLVVIQGARSRDLMILQDDLRELADEYLAVTDDGSAGRRDPVTEPLREACKAVPSPDRVFAIGPAPMMESCADLTFGFGIPTQVSLNTMMLDATGMCGGCRIRVGGKIKFVCTDGPVFDGHELDFEQVTQRMSLRTQEREMALSYTAARNGSRPEQPLSPVTQLRQNGQNGQNGHSVRTAESRLYPGRIQKNTRRCRHQPAA